METPKSSPKDVFLHLMVFVALYVSVVSLIALLFQCINFWYPDPLSFYYESVLSGIRWSASALIVMYAVYIGVSWMINKDLQVLPEKKNIKVRKWLIYLTLFASALTVIIDIIVLIYNYLGGDITTRFFLKILAVLFVAGLVFAYYIWDMKTNADRRQLKIFAWIISLLILFVIVTGFIVVGSPSTQRARRFDQQRVNDLQTIQGQVVSYWSEKGLLPANLSDLKSSISGFVAPLDPETQASYEYQIKSTLNFELCAKFNQASLNQGPIATPAIYPNYKTENWSHGVGRVCFDRTIDPQRDKIPQTPFVK